MSSIQIRKVSITKVGTSAIVNAANEQLMQGGGVCGFIFNAAGASKLQKACDRIGFCNTGDAVITPGFDLCDHIIHAVGPIYINGLENEPQMLYNCYRSSLNLCRENDIHSVGFPLISAGIFGYPVDKAWRKALQSCNDWISKNNDYDIDIVFAIIDDRILKVGMDTAKELGIELTEDSNEL